MNIRLDIYIHIYICIHICIYIFIYVYTNVHDDMHECSWIWIYDSKYVCNDYTSCVLEFAYTTYTNIYDAIYIYIYLYIYIYIYTHKYMYIYIYIYIYTYKITRFRWCTTHTDMWFKWVMTHLQGISREPSDSWLTWTCNSSGSWLIHEVYHEIQMSNDSFARHITRCNWFMTHMHTRIQWVERHITRFNWFMTHTEI